MTKKHLIIWLSILVLFFWLTKATSWLIDIISSLWANIEFWYITDTIAVDNITASKVTFKSPFILDWAWNKITKYIIMYSPKSLSEMETDTTLLAQSKQKQFDITGISNATFTMDLISTWDVFSWNQIYYISVIPQDNSGTIGEFSNEMCFRLDTRISGEWSDCINWKWVTPENSHSAWWADMSLANISFTKNWNTITLRWISVEWSDNVEIFLQDPDSQDYTKLWVASILDEEFSFTTHRNGEHRVKFIPDNWGTEHIYTFQVSWVSWWTPGWTIPPSITKVPKVWPKENIIAIIIFTFGIYLVYKRAKRNS